MKNKLILLCFIAFILKGCYKEPFDNALLDSDYWNNFNLSIEKIAFDTLGVLGSYGFYANTETNSFVYNSDVFDSTYSEQKSYIHHIHSNKVQFSTVDTIEFHSMYNHPQIKWETEASGIIKKAYFYNNEGA